MRIHPGVLALAIILISWPAFAQAGDGRFDLGLRVNVVAADGEPANDILGAGLFGRYRLTGRWWLGFAVDTSSGFDVERPYELVGLTDPGQVEIDASADMTAVSLWLEREHDPPGRLEWFWSIGAGVADVSVDDLSGTLSDGTRFDITQDVGSELLALVSGGLRLRFAGRWALEGTITLEQHFTDWQVTERLSGRTAALDDYLVQGVRLGVSYRF